MVAVNISIRSRFGPPSFVDAVILMTLFPGKTFRSVLDLYYLSCVTLTASMDQLTARTVLPTNTMEKMFP